VSAGTAPVASASLFHFEAPPGTSELVKGTAQGKHSIDLAGGTLSCEQLKLEGLTKGSVTVESLEFVAVYGGCTMFGGKATVNMHGCRLQIWSNGRLAVAGEMMCTLEPMTIDVSVLGQECHIKLTPTTANEALTFGNIGSGSKREMTMAVNGSGLFYSAEGSLCKETGSKMNGAYTSGATLFTAEKSPELSGPMNGIWWE
jgi:hypothetical protein